MAFLMIECSGVVVPVHEADEDLVETSFGKCEVPPYRSLYVLKGHTIVGVGG